MIYLSGAKNSLHNQQYADGVIGLLRTPANGYRLDGVKVWAMDNGCFSGQYPGDEAFLKLLEGLLPHQSRCLFVTAPDVMADGVATLARLPDMGARLRAAGWPVALVGQDGMEDLEVPWQLVDWLFVGGSTEWKLGDGARALVAQALANGKQVHVGRVNSGKRFTLFANMGAHSADGTYIGFGPIKNLPNVLRWIASTT